MAPEEPMGAPALASQQIVRAIEYIKAVESGATGEALARFLHPDVTHYDLPNRFSPAGKVSDRAAMLAAAERGQKVFRSQKYDVLSSLEQDNSVVLEMDWIGKLAVPMSGIPAGGEIHARIATFLEFEDGLLIMQRDYVCYDSF
jgi:hypothetical protein